MDYRVSSSDLTSVANAIRTKGETSASLSFPDGFITAIQNISGGGERTTIVPEQTVTVSGSYTQLQYNSAIVSGEEYIVTINGTTKNLTAVTNSGGVFLLWDSSYQVLIEYSSSSLYLDVMNSSLYGSYTVKVEQESGGATLITKSITANGTYNAEDDSADGYSSVTVAVPSKLVTGTFTGTTTGAAMEVSVSYTGNGYPVAGIIYPTSGGNTGSIASLAQKYAEIQYAFCKMDTSSTPTYSGDTSENKATVTSLYKYSDSDATSSTAGRLLTQQFYHSANAGATATACVKMKSKNTMSVYIASTSYGFPANIEFTYQLIYSA